MTTARATPTTAYCSRRAAGRAGFRSAALTTSSISGRSTTTGICARSLTPTRTVVIGGGFIGSEIAAALAIAGCSVSMVFPEPGVGARVFPAELSAAIGAYYREQGVELLAGASVSGIERHGEKKRVLLADRRVLEADAVVAGLGIEPNTELAASAGLPVANGIVVDAFGRVAAQRDVLRQATSRSSRWPELEARCVSNTKITRSPMAVGSARTWLARTKAYDHLPFFYSDLFDLGYEAVGELDPRLDTLSELESVHEPGVVYYLDSAHRARGVLLWNLFGRVDDARELIRAGEDVRAGALGERVR